MRRALEAGFAVLSVSTLVVAAFGIAAGHDGTPNTSRPSIHFVADEEELAERARLRPVRRPRTLHDTFELPRPRHVTVRNSGDKDL